MYTAIHVDDDPRSLDLMRLAASELPELNLLASLDSGAAAQAWLSENKADIIFLDVEMPEQNGFQVARELAAYSTDIVFVTAHADFAVRAFEACALDYLVKPIYAEKLQACLARYAVRMGKRQGTAAPSPVAEQMQELTSNYLPENAYPKRIFVSMIGEIRVINLDEVIYFGASGPYTKIFLASGEVVTCSETIKSYSESLVRHPDFVRIHRSYLISKKAIASIQRKDGNHNVKMSNGDVLAIAQQRRGEIFQQIAS